MVANQARIAKMLHNLWNIPIGYSKYWSDPLEALGDVMCKLILFASLGGLLAKGLHELLNDEAVLANHRRANPDLLRTNGFDDYQYVRSNQTSPVANRASRQWCGPAYLMAISIIAAYSMTIEMLQVYLPPHVADVTDVLNAAFGGLLAWPPRCTSKQEPASPAPIRRLRRASRQFDSPGT